MIKSAARLVSASLVASCRGRQVAVPCRRARTVPRHPCSLLFPPSVLPLAFAPPAAAAFSASLSSSRFACFARNPVDVGFHPLPPDFLMVSSCHPLVTGVPSSVGSSLALPLSPDSTSSIVCASSVCLLFGAGSSPPDSLHAPPPAGGVAVAPPGRGIEAAAISSSAPAFACAFVLSSSNLSSGPSSSPISRLRAALLCIATCCRCSLAMFASTPSNVGSSAGALPPPVACLAAPLAWGCSYTPLPPPLPRGAHPWPRVEPCGGLADVLLFLQQLSCPSPPCSPRTGPLSLSVSSPDPCGGFDLAPDLPIAILWVRHLAPLPIFKG